MRSRRLASGLVAAAVAVLVPCAAGAQPYELSWWTGDGGGGSSAGGALAEGPACVTRTDGQTSSVPRRSVTYTIAGGNAGDGGGVAERPCP